MAVYKFKKGWRYDFERAGIRFTKTGFKTKSEARAAEAKAKEKAILINLKFGRLCARRLKNLKINRTNNYLKENQSLFKKLIKRWALKSSITRDDVELYLEEVALESRVKANKYLRLIKALFGYGVERGWVNTNPVSGIKPFSYEKQRRYVPSKEDVLKVLSLARPDKRLYLLTLIHTAGRMRELNYLKWEDVHEDYLVLWTRKAKNSVLTDRVIPYNQVLKEVIEKLREQKIGEYVFTNPETLKPYDYQRKLLKKLCKKAEVRYFSYHALRHFSASTLAEGGAPLPAIQEILGHSTARTTSIYLRSLKPTTIDSMKKLEGIR
jgi:integrase